MENVKKYLQAWSLSHLIAKFEEEAIDDDTFSKINTDSQDFKELIAKYGDRIKFKEGFRQLYNRIDEENVITDNNCLETIVVKTNDAPSDTSVYKETQEPIPSTSKGTCSTVYRVDDNLPLDIVPVPYKRCDSFLEKLPNLEVTYELDLKKFLQNSIKGRNILAQKNHLTPQLRDDLVALLNDHDLLQDINSYIPTRRLLQLARLIKQEFPNEDISTYYIPYVRQNKKTVQCMRGKLVDRYHNQRKKLKKSGVLTTACPSSSLEVHETVEIASSQDYEDDVEDFCCWLRYNTEPWPEVLAKWKATTCVRIPRYNQNTTTTIQEYFQEYKILEKSLGYQLLEIDFNYLYPKKSEIFFAEIHKKKTYYITIGPIPRRTDSTFSGSKH
ncbi:uncharacterized protein LOC135121438 isoform X1 [Zophobas morio]|uniref:uncharacterized protein LOC135121438 isoform X1 n=1 Tax=Zophobas morio TaxID=2755281 RepID=UPI003082DC04